MTSRGTVVLVGSSIGEVAAGSVLHCTGSVIDGGRDFTINGNGNVIRGTNVIVNGNNNRVTGPNARVTGNGNRITGNDCIVNGNYNVITGSGCIAEGNGNYIRNIPRVVREIPLPFATVAQTSHAIVTSVTPPATAAPLPARATGTIVNDSTQPYTPAYVQGNVIYRTNPAPPAPPPAISYPEEPKESEAELETNDPSDARLCIICLTHPRATVAVPCGHSYGCVACVRKSQPIECPVCRAKLTAVIRLFT